MSRTFPWENRPEKPFPFHNELLVRYEYVSEEYRAKQLAHYEELFKRSARGVSRTQNPYRSYRYAIAAFWRALSCHYYSHDDTWRTRAHQVQITCIALRDALPENPVNYRVQSKWIREYEFIGEYGKDW